MKNFCRSSLQLHIYCQLKNELLQTDGKIVAVTQHSFYRECNIITQRLDLFYFNSQNVCRRIQLKNNAHEKSQICQLNKKLNF